MKYYIIIPVIFILIFCGCASEPAYVNRDNQKRTDISHAGHIIFIGFDGFGSKYIPKANMPNLKKMINEGSSCMDVYNILPPVSGPNWHSLFKGTPFDKQTADNFPSIMTLFKNAGKDTVYFYEWHGMKSISDADNIRSIRIKSDYESAVIISEYIKENKPAFTSIVYNEPDLTGHKKCYGSKSYYKKLELLDEFILLIRQAAIDAEIYDETVFIISSDHGGEMTGHYVNLKSIRKIPLVFFGKNIKQGHKITATAGIFDIAPTMAVIFGLDIPSEWTGAPVWEIFK